MSRPMRILLASDYLPPAASGAGNAAWALAGGLRDLGHEVYMIAGTAGPASVQLHEGVEVSLISATLPERWLAYFSLYNPPAVRAFKQHLERIRPDVINVHNLHNRLSYGCIAAASRRGYPVVLTAHDVMPVAYAKLTHYVNPSSCPDDSPATYRLPLGYNLRQARFRYNPLRNLWIRHSLHRHVRLRLAVSNRLRLALEGNGLPPFEVVHPGVRDVAASKAPAAVERLRRRYGLEGRPVVLLAGRLSAAKGVQQALRAFEILLHQVPDAVLLMLSRQTVELGRFASRLGGNVIQGGWLTGDELAAAYGLSQIVILPSIYLEPFSLVGLEAMAAAKPVIASCHCGIVEGMVDGVTGFIVNPFEAQKFAGIMSRLLLDGTFRRKLGLAGYQRYCQDFTHGQYALRMQSAFDRIVR